MELLQRLLKSRPVKSVAPTRRGALKAIESLEDRRLLSVSSLAAWPMLNALSRGCVPAEVTAAEVTAVEITASEISTADTSASTRIAQVSTEPQLGHDAFTAALVATTESPVQQAEVIPQAASEVSAAPVAGFEFDDGPPIIAQADATDLVELRLEVTDLANTPVSTLTVGDSFKLRGYAQSIGTAAAAGVFAAFLDVTYSSLLAAPTSAITHGTIFTNGTAGTLTAGLIDEVGGINSGSGGITTEQLLFEVTFNASSAGNLTFVADAADTTPIHDTLLFGTTSAVLADDIDFINASVTIQNEAPIDLVQFAQDLADANAVFYGAAWCPHCTAQKELFQDGQSFLPFVEVTNPDKTPNQIAIDNNITEYPTWVFDDGSRLVGEQTLEALATAAGISIPQSDQPFLKEIGAKDLLSGSPLLVALDGYDPNGQAISYSVTSDNPTLVEAIVMPRTDRSLRLSVAGYGDMVFQLFESRVPRVTDHIIQLAESDFYNGITFHRIIDEFVIQGGDPTGTGAGGSDLGNFDDQFDVDLQHNQTGILSMAKTDDDTNDSQFFIVEESTTTGLPRHLDFNHSIFGYLVEGESNREAISMVPVDSPANGSPLTDVVMDDVSVFTDVENAVLMLRAPEGTSGTANITVTLTDAQNNIVTETFTVTVTPDTVNGTPFLTDFTQDIYVTAHDTDLVIPVDGIDAEGSPIDFEAILSFGPEGVDIVTDDTAKTVTVTPPAGFAGEMEVLIGSLADVGSAFDSQLVDVRFDGIDLWEDSDSGSSRFDNLTNENTLEIRVTGVANGADVTLFRDGATVATLAAIGDTATFSYDASGDTGEVVFTAEVDDGANVTTVDHQLTVTIDRTPPDAIDSVAPATVKAGSPLGYDVSSPSEGDGFVYSFGLDENDEPIRPAGASINAENGQITWLPGFNLIDTTGDFEVVLADPAGNTVTQAFTTEVIVPDPLVEFSVVVEDLSGNPITSILVGTEFQVTVLVDDVRPASTANNIFNAFVDMSYDSSLISIPTGAALEIGSNFQGVLQSGTNTIPGLIDEAGGTNLTAATDPVVVFSQRFSADATGTVTFQTAQAVDPSSSTLHNVNLNNPSQTANVSQIVYGLAELNVVDQLLAVDDTFSVAEDSTTPLDVLLNDTLDVAGLVTATGTPNQGGSVTIDGDGLGVTYAPAADFVGTETFTYTLSDGGSISSTATVTVTVTNVNDPPVANNDSVELGQNEIEFAVDVLANDSFAPDSGETLTISAVSATANGGTAVRSVDNLTVLYTPPSSSFIGTDTFTYTLSDGNGGSASATVTVTVTLAVTDAPDLELSADTGVSDTDNITNANTLDFVVNNVLDGATVTLKADGNPVGTPVVAVGNSVSFSIDATGLSGEVQFTASQTVGSETSRDSDILAVTIDRTAPAAISSTPDDAAFVGVLFDYDVESPEEGDVVYSLVGAPAAASIDPTTGVINWTPQAADLGALSFTVMASDLAGNETTQLVDLVVADKQVEFTVDFVDQDGNSITSVGVGSLFTLQVFAEDLRPGIDPGDAGVATAFTEVTFADALFDAVGAPQVDPVFSDGLVTTGQIASGRIEATGGANTDTNSDAPMLVFEQQFRATTIGTAAFQTEFAVDFELDGTPTDFFEITLFGQVVAVPEEGINFGSGTMEVVAGLTAVADALSVDEDSAATTIDALANDTSGPTSGALTITSVGTATGGGTVTILGAGATLSYTPVANFFGTDTFTYTVSDESGATSTGTVTVTVNSVNDPPIAADDVAETVSNADAITIDVLANDTTDPDPNEVLTISSVTNGTQGGVVSSINGSTQVQYTPAADFSGTDTFTYTVVDGNGGSDSATVTVTVNEFNPTNVTGSVFLDANGNGVQDEGEMALANIEVALDGTDANGLSVHQTTRTATDGSYTFTALSPGSYTITQTASTLLVGGAVLSSTPTTDGSGISVNPDNSGGTSGANNFGAGGLLPQFAMLYALSSTPETPVEMASDASGATQWQLLDTTWGQFTSLEVILSADAKTVTVNATDSGGTDLTATVSTTRTDLVQVLGQVSGTRLVRLVGQPADFNLQPA